MVKYLLSSLIVFIFLTSSSWASTSDARMLANLKNEYGQDLTKAPYFLRFSFEKVFNKPWEKSYYYERRIFLEHYEDQVAADKAKDKAEAKAAAEKEKERLREKKEELRKENERIKEEQAEQKEEQKEEDQRQRDFNDQLKQQQQELQQMEKQATSGNQ